MGQQRQSTTGACTSGAAATPRPPCTPSLPAHPQTTHNPPPSRPTPHPCLCDVLPAPGCRSAYYTLASGTYTWGCGVHITPGTGWYGNFQTASQAGYNFAVAGYVVKAWPPPPAPLPPPSPTSSSPGRRRLTQAFDLLWGTRSNTFFKLTAAFTVRQEKQNTAFTSAKAAAWCEAQAEARPNSGITG